MRTIGADLVRLTNETLERELALGPAGERVVRLGIHTRCVQLATLKAVDRGEVVEGCDPRPHDEILATDVPPRPWPDLESEARNVVRLLADRIETLNDDELLAEEPWREIGEPPLWRQLLVSCSGQQVTAISEHLRDEGELQRAIELNEWLRARLQGSTLPPKAEAFPIYNLACLQAGAGRSEQALALLAEALRLTPHLVEWSRKDRDLDPIREEPAYAALVA